MIHNKNVPTIDGMDIDKAHKGGGFKLLGRITGGLFGSNKDKAKQAAMAYAQAREMEARRMASSQTPADERAKLNLNTGDGQSNLGTLGLLVEPTGDKKRTSKTGLGGLDSVQAGLGFGTKGKVS